MNSNNKRRWLILIFGTLILMFCSLIYGWSLFSQYFSEAYPKWSLPQLSMVFTISMVGFSFGGLFSSILSKKYCVKKILWISTAVIFIGFFGVSQMHTDNSEFSLVMLYILYGGFAGLGVGMTYNVVISTVSKWFPDKSGAAIGFMMMGFGCGTIILGSILLKLIYLCGIFDTYLILGIGVSVIVIIGSFLIRTPYEEKTNGTETLAFETQDNDSKTTKYVVHDAAFWIYMCWAVIVNIAGMMIIGNAATIALSAGAAAIVGMIVSVCNGVGRILVGALFDNIGRTKTMIISMSTLIIAGAILVLSACENVLSLTIIGLILMGFQYGGNPVIASSFVRSQYGPKYYSSNFAIINFCAVPAAIIGPTVASIILTKTGGSYMQMYFVMIGCGIISVFVFFMLNKSINSKNNLCLRGEKNE